jgi:hypothetical protein
MSGLDRCICGSNDHESEARECLGLLFKYDDFQDLRAVAESSDLQDRSVGAEFIFRIPSGLARRIMAALPLPLAIPDDGKNCPYCGQRLPTRNS